MGTKEIDAVRAFCRAAQGLACEIWKCDTNAAIGRVVRHLWSKTDVEVRSMIEVGRVIGKLERGMTAAAIATSSGPVTIKRSDDGGFFVTMGATTTIPRLDASNPAIVLYEALVAAGGPLEDEPPVGNSDAGCSDGYRQTLLGGRESLDGGAVFNAQADLLARETVGILQAAVPVVGWRAFVGAVCVERVDAGWEVTKAGVEPATVPPDAWDALWATLHARLR